MTEEFVVGLGRQALWAVLLVAGPFLAASLAVGLLVSLFQAMTQVHEQTLAFVPKIVAVFLTAALVGPWILRYLTDFATRLVAGAPGWVR
ncbi:MAG: flagellar biosynthesis protein FliQ [Clostridia bacterium]|nr:flagellar biosynthesis protein FliQ [Clostridia bacterium]